jgi:hypothetical protein
MSLNTIEQDNILEVVARQEQRIAQLEAMLNGQGIRMARIADASITDAKIQSLSADKITTGTLSVGVTIRIRNEADTADQGAIGYLG